MQLMLKRAAVLCSFRSVVFVCVGGRSVLSGGVCCYKAAPLHLSLVFKNSVGGTCAFLSVSARLKVCQHKAESCRTKKKKSTQPSSYWVSWHEKTKIPVSDVGYHVGSYELCLLGWAFCFRLCELFLKNLCFMNYMTLLLHTMSSMHPPYYNQRNYQVMMIKCW